MTEMQRCPGLPRALATVIATAAAIACLAGCSPQSQGYPPGATARPGDVTLTAAQRQRIRLYTVAESKFHKTLDTTGAVDFDNDQATSVLAPFSGPVTRVLVEPGDRVRKGDPLAAVESPDFAAAVSGYRKALATAATARRVADVDQDLARHNGISQREEQQAQTDAINAEADRDAALKALTSLNVDPQTVRNVREGKPISRIEGLIRSPIAGTVVERLITPGELLQAGTTPCFTVADLSRVWVMAQIFGSDTSSVAVGDPAQVVTGIAGKDLPGTVANISALVDPDTRSVKARVVVANPGGILKKQMYVRVRIRSRRESTGVLVPASAVLRDDENLPFVYVAQPDGSFARRHVTLGYRDGERYAIDTGLAPRDQVVVEGGVFMQFMQTQ